MLRHFILQLLLLIRVRKGLIEAFAIRSGVAGQQFALRSGELVPACRRRRVFRGCKGLSIGVGVLGRKSEFWLFDENKPICLGQSRGRRGTGSLALETSRGD